MPKIITVNGFISARLQNHYDLEEWCQDGVRYAFDLYEGRDGYVTIMPHTITFELPDGFDLRPAAIKELEAKKQKLMAEFQVVINEINDRITKLQSLEMSV